MSILVVGGTGFIGPRVLSRLRQEFDIDYPPFRTRILEIINDVRLQEGQPRIEAR